MPISVASPPRGSRLAPPLRALVRAALALEGRRPGEIGIVLADDARLRALNRRFRGLDRATDVLSFGYEGSGQGWGGGVGSARDALATRGGRSRNASRGATRSQGRRSGAGVARGPHASAPATQIPASGDLVVSLDRVRVQARRYRVSRGRELARLVVHGALHLAGLDHHRAVERRHMRRREAQVLAAARAEVARLDRALDGLD